MKNPTTIFFASCLAISVLIGLTACSDGPSSSAENKSSTSEASMNTPSHKNPIEGAWYLVWGEYNGEPRNESEPFQIKLFTEKHFTYVMKSTEGKWEGSSAGTYELLDGIYRETHLHGTNPDIWGKAADWEFEVRGDSLFMNGPVKITNENGEDATDMADVLNSMREIRVRAD